MQSLYHILIILFFGNLLITPVLANSLPSVSPMDEDKESQFIKNQHKITISEINQIKPIIKNWLDYYQLDISNFYTGKVGSWPFDENYHGIYTREFDPITDDVYIPEQYDYSPSKQKYLDYLPIFKEKDKYVFVGNQDCQEVYLVDREKQTTTIVLWLGSKQFLEAVFWKDENNFIAVGFLSDNPTGYFIYTYGPNNKYIEYYYEVKPENFKVGYFNENLKTRGVVNE